MFVVGSFVRLVFEHIGARRNNYVPQLFCSIWVLL